MRDRPSHISSSRIIRSQRGATYTLVFAVALPAITLLTVGLVDVSRFMVAKDDIGAALEQAIMSVEGDLRALNMTEEGVIPPAESECLVRGKSTLPCTRSALPQNVEALNPAAARQLAISACARAAAILVGGSSIFNYQYLGSAHAASGDPIYEPPADDVWNELTFQFAVFKSDGTTLTTFSSGTANAGEPTYCTASADAGSTNALRTELASSLSSLIWSQHIRPYVNHGVTYWLAGKITSQVDGLFSRYLTGSSTSEVSNTFVRALPWPYSMETD